MNFNFLKNTAFYSSVYQFLCLGCIFVLVFNKVFSISFLDVSILRHFVRSLCYVLAVLNLVVFIREKNYRICLIFLSCLLVGILCKKFSSSNDLLQLALFSFAFAKVNFRKAIFVFILTVSVTVLIIVLSSCLDLIDEILYTFRDNEIRNAFGFRHPNALGAIIFFLIMTVWTYCKNSTKNNLLIILALIFASFFIGSFVDSRTAQYMCILASAIILGVVVLTKFIKEERIFSNSIIKCLLRSSFLIIALISFDLGYLYSKDSPFFVFLNELLSGRLHLANNAIMNFAITPFGQILKLSDLDVYNLSSSSSTHYQLLDSFYLSVLYNWGFASLLVFVFIFDMLMKKAIIRHNSKLVITLICFAIYGITEYVYYLICFNIFIYLALAYQNQNIDKDSN